MRIEKIYYIVYISKYALTKGIYEMEVYEKYDSIIRKDNDDRLQIEDRFIHTTYEYAKIKAKEMKENKIKSLDKQLRKVKSLTF